MISSYPPELQRKLNEIRNLIRQHDVDIKRLWGHTNYGQGWPVGGQVPLETLGGPWDEFPETSTSSTTTTTTTTTTSSTPEETTTTTTTSTTPEETTTTTTTTESTTTTTTTTESTTTTSSTEESTTTTSTSSTSSCTEIDYEQCEFLVAFWEWDGTQWNEQVTCGPCCEPNGAAPVSPGSYVGEQYVLPCQPDFE